MFVDFGILQEGRTFPANVNVALCVRSELCADWKNPKGPDSSDKQQSFSIMRLATCGQVNTANPSSLLRLALLLLLLLLVLVCGTDAKMDIITSKQDVLVGEEMLLLCKAGGEGELRWQKDGEDIDDEEKVSTIDETSSKLLIKNAMMQDAGKYTCLCEFESGHQDEVQIQLYVYEGERVRQLTDNTLRIEKVKREDAGTYVCQAQIRGRPIYQHLSVSVVVNDQYCVTQCALRSSLHMPRPSKFDPSHHRFNSDSSELTIRSVAIADYGEYICTAVNKIAEDSATIVLHVFDPLAITALKPYTLYAVRLAALNAVGLGKFSDTSSVRTQGIREPDSPVLSSSEIKIEGNSLSVPLKQTDDGGAPLLHFIIRYREDKEGAEWKELELPSSADTVSLRDLSFGSNYQLEVTAGNSNGSSMPATMNFTIAEKPPSGRSMTKGSVVGIVMVIFLVVFLVVDATCCYRNRCGLLMSIAVKLFGQKVPGQKMLEEGPGATNGRNAPSSATGSGEPAPLSTMDETDVEQVTLALLDAANDKDSAVQEQVRKSMLTLGKQQPDRVLAMCQDYLLKHPKLVVSHRVVILRTIELIASCKIEEITSPSIKRIIALASDEMTRSKEVIPDWQQAASNILVAVGNKHINDIMEEILNKFQPGVLPHFFVVQTLANLSESNVYGMVPFLNAILGTMLPMLSMAKQDNMKWVFSSALCHFSDSILEYLANLDKAPDPTVRKDTFSSEIYAAFEILFNNWLQSRESKLRLTVAEAVGSMCHLMASDKLEEQIPKLIPAVLSLYKKNNEHYIISKSLCQVLDASVNMGSRVLETQLDSLFLALHQQVSAPTDYNNPPTVKNHNEVLRCFSLLANSFPDRLVMFVLQKLENSNERSRMGSLAVLRHLINSSTSTMESKKLLILASIRQPMADHSNKVKKRVVQVISAMAHHGYLELEGGELLVRFIVQHCALHDTNQRGERQSDPEEVTNEALRAMCDSTLHLLTTTVGRLADVLWPKLLYYLTPSQFSNATTPLCKSLVVLGNKKKSNQEPSFNINFTQEESTAQSLDKKHWNEKLLKFLSKTLATIDDDKWVCQLAAEATRYLSTYNNALEEKSFLYQCIGVTLQQCFNKEVVKKQLQEVLLTARHSDAVEREGVAIGIGLCANSHLEGTLAKLDEFGKSDAFKKSPSIFNLLKERNDVEVEKVKSTLILCYGQVALNAPPEKILNRIDQDILRCISKHFNTKDLTMKLSLIQSVGLIAKAISECVKKQGYIFSRKQELIGVMLCFIFDHSSVRPLDPVLSENESFDLLKALHKDTLAALQELLKSVLAKEPTPDGLQNVFKNMVSFHNLGALLGRLSPRCSDPQPAVRTAAINSIYTLLYIQLRYEGFSLDYKDEAVDSLLPLRDRLENPDHSVLYKTCSDLTKVRVAVGQTVLILASQHLQTVFNTLVNQPLPYDSWTSEMWMALGADPIVANQIIEMVMEKLVIMAPYVDKKEYVMRGGTTKVATNQPLAVNKYAKELLAAMSSGMEEKDDPGKLITLEAMSGLSKVLLYLDKKNVHLMVVYIFMKIKPFLESENDEIRCASIYLMGNLSKFGSGEQVFKDQIHNVLVSLLLHLVDPNPHVVKACKFAMRVCAPVVGSEQITTMFQNHLHDDKSLHYGEFINDLTKYLIQDFPGMLNFYHISVIQFFKSNWPEVRAGAAMFIGLVMLLQDPDPVVRVKAAEAMGHFH
ncbi:hypothetical protein F2P81_001655 [Scophthalmus maximus]|uniref:Maestro heat-like repeat-containing protein family member 1 n=1 Tax=Scophthalmus maximus TaxID=52904 RepID=A0A6A4TBY4_SCOMX|nr:hypothetical protein F2P81_001655 [Scophthalmus maximus]